jgi:hypothetical protein
MKKYKIQFSIFNLFQATQEEVARLQTVWAGFSAPIIASAFITSSERNALIAAIICGLVDKLLACLYLEEKK